MISFLKHKEIDKTKWDDCIDNSINGLIYVKSFYLDYISSGWNALVLNDYEMVMPLTWRKKYFINYLYQPSFFQQGGIYSRFPTDQYISIQFLEKALVHYRYIDISLNYLNDIDTNFFTSAVKRNNFLLPLYSGAYLEIQKREGFKQALAKSFQQNLMYESTTDFEQAITLYKDIYIDRIPSVNKEDLSNFFKICKICKENENLIIRKATFKNEIVAIVLLLKDKKRIYNLISCITVEGKKLNSNYFLYYNLIKEFSGTNLILDLEGSDIEGIKFFYKRITDLNQPYFKLKINNLPFDPAKIKRLIK